MILGELEFAHKDPRRTIHEFSSIEGRFSVQSFSDVEIESGPLGRHGHRFKTETFVILEGEGFVLVARINSACELLEQPTKVSVKAGMVIHFRPLEAHTFYLKPGAKMICFGDQPFYKEDNDFAKYDDLVIENYPDLTA